MLSVLSLVCSSISRAWSVAETQMAWYVCNWWKAAYQTTVPVLWRNYQK